MNDLLNDIKLKNQNDIFFINSITEFVESLNIEINTAALTKLLHPDRIFEFSIPWVDRNGITQINTGYRVQYNNALGPYKGGLRFDKDLNIDTLKFLAFEQTLKNSLTGRDIGGAKGGSDFDPKHKTDAEILSFCQSFINHFYTIFGPTQDVPAGDIGVGQKEIGYMYNQYKLLTQQVGGVLTGKHPSINGVIGRSEATGYGVVYILQALLKHKEHNIEGKRVIVSGTGNVALHAAYKAVELGAIVVAMSDRTGYVYNHDGLNIKSIEKHKQSKQSLDTYELANYSNKESIWSIPCDIALPCATQYEMNEAHLKLLETNGCNFIVEGANKPLTKSAVEYVITSNISYLPGKAANAGGVAISSVEMSQNAQMTTYSIDYVDNKLKEIMNEIFQNITHTAKEYGQPNNYLMGANIFAYKRLEKAILMHGIL